ncbi:MAG: adenylate kinase [SAR324 cluster bacterium]|nr:adenylate kinase [SAR324 cluster bacterium]
MKKNIHIILLGPPGCGKGTQAQKLIREFGFVQLSTGDMLRAAISKGTEIGMQAKSIIDKGELVSDEIVIGIVRDRIFSTECECGYMLDGFPRTLAQAEKLDQILSDRNQKIDVVFRLCVPDDMAIRRIAGRRFHITSGRSYNIEFNPPKIEGRDDITGEKLVQREDDKEEIVQSRLNTYHELTEPLVRYYQKQGILKAIDGTGSPENIYAEIKQTLNEVPA